MPIKNKGFTLVEMIVAVGLFAIVMIVATGAIFSIVNANRSAQALNSAITNFSFAAESMIRDIRTGSVYDCLAEVNPSPNNCLNSGNSSISFINADGNKIIYALSGNQIVKSVGGATAQPITAPEVTIQSMTFFVNASAPTSGTNNHLAQPEILLRITGYAGVNANKSNFDIQTLISQRLLNTP